jgi:hypothetical protein
VPGEIETYLREHHPTMVDVALWACDVVAASDQDLRPRVYRGWEGVGFRHPEAGYVCGVFPRGEWVMLLFEHGASMADPERVLLGEGTQTRFLRIDGVGEETAALISRYVQQAVAERLFESK